MKPTNGPRPASALLQEGDERAGKYLSFRLGKEDFAVPVLSVREIMARQDVTVVPQTPAYLKGVMNLRGRAIPVIDLKLKLGIPETGPGTRPSIVVIHVESEGGRLLVGLLVDSVSEVLQLKTAEIDRTTPAGHQALTPYLLGVAKLKARFKFVLDINLVLTPHEVHNLEAVLV